MKLFTVAIGKDYELQAERLRDSIDVPIDVFTTSNDEYVKIHENQCVDALYHKANFANYIEDTEESILLVDADIFSMRDNPLVGFKPKRDTDVAFVTYGGSKFHFPDKPRQEAFDHFGYKINSGFVYFRTLDIARDVCDSWVSVYTERVVKTFDETGNNEYDEYALMTALMRLNYKIELLDPKWNNWEKMSREEILNCDSIFIQSHDYLDIIKDKQYA